MKDVGAAAARALSILSEKANTAPGSLLVVGCSTSVVAGGEIGRASSLPLARDLFEALLAEAKALALRIAFQTCEHLNRALVVVGDAPDYGRTVAAIPVPGAGGALAAYAFAHLPGARLVERVEATLGLDIGLTLIGMHLRPVAVPVHGLPKVGEAPVVGAYSRPPLIGGERAVYRREEQLARLGSWA